MRLIKAIETSDGAGVKIFRSIGGTQQVEDYDPLLMLDEFSSENSKDYINGFPEHPHRGFQTLTYMLNGTMYHEDSLNNSGKLGPGDVQWMTAGKGIIHSEMPAQEKGLMRGFQLWVNLPSKDKYCEPTYLDIRQNDIPTLKEGSVITKVIAGRFNDIMGPIDSGATKLDFLDIRRTQSEQRLMLNKEKKHFVYVFEGELIIDDKLLIARCGTSLHKNSTICCRNFARYLVISALPLKEPIVKYGPFVMNNKSQILEAIEKYKNGTFGT